MRRDILLLFLILMLFEVNVNCSSLFNFGFFNFGFNIDNAWNLFKTSFNKNYMSQTEESIRREFWNSHFNMVQNHNRRFIKGEVLFNLEMNMFADFTDNEKESLLTFKPDIYDEDVVLPKKFHRLIRRDAENSTNVHETEPETETEAEIIPENFNWVDYGAVTEVKNQAKCGGCWAFGTTGALEGAYFLQTGNLASFSEQHLIDCNFEPKKGNYGCSGGTYLQASRFLKANGFVNESSYSFTGTKGICKNDTSSYYTDYRVSGCAQLGAKNNETAMKEMLYKNGPVAVGLDAKSLFYYKSGIFSDQNCTKKVNHAVLIVGYGTENGVDYWIVKNSWGPKWGENGFFRIRRNNDNECGIVSNCCFIQIEKIKEEPKIEE